ncbi:hypothetical protein AgCh_017125 [Apium graveolens]
MVLATVVDELPPDRVMLIYLSASGSCAFNGLRRTPEDALPEEKDAQTKEERFTKEEWQAINSLLSYQPNEDLIFHSGKDVQNRTRYLIDILVG